ncbi:sensor histidine kinase [Streptococcus henryi]|uniref:sensor histidine kinase n=1 Tax=Streptococcus henryi TaxID=439219 RepID=UPI0003713E77|nr:GHKL domain-containing protein [Streptococcus henryi]
MTAVYKIIYLLIDIGLPIFLFSKVNANRFSSKELTVAFLIRIAIMLLPLSSEHVFYYLSLPIYMILLSFLIWRHLSKVLIIFYGLFPITLWNLFYRSISFFVLPLFGIDSLFFESSFYNTILDFIAILLVLLFLKWLKYDFSKLRSDLLDRKDRNILYLTNWIMVSYYIIVQMLTYLEFEKKINTQSYREIMIILYLIIFMGMITSLDRHLKDRLQEKLNFQQELQLINMENYSTHIEELYREVKGFRHDYTNLLTTLRLGIEDENLEQIKEVYNSVLKDTNQQFHNKKYDIGRLININNPALKSLLSAKFMQASENNISVTLEVPEAIEPQGMELVDFITIVSILCDNAIEAALEVEKNSFINIAYLKVDKKHLFIIENASKQETVPTPELYSYGVSSKGEGRGIGLNNVLKIIDKYPNVSINTSSQNHKFCQVFEIRM